MRIPVVLVVLTAGAVCAQGGASGPVAYRAYHTAQADEDRSMNVQQRMNAQRNRQMHPDGEPEVDGNQYPSNSNSHMRNVVMSPVRMAKWGMRQTDKALVGTSNAVGSAVDTTSNAVGGAVDTTGNIVGGAVDTTDNAVSGAVDGTDSVIRGSGNVVRGSGNAVRGSGAIRGTRNTNSNSNTSDNRCSSRRMLARNMPDSYNDKTAGFFVDMGLILTDYYGLTAKMSKLQMGSVARSFIEPVRSFAQAQKQVSADTLYRSVVGLLRILIHHTVNDTFISREEWNKYQIDGKVFSEMQVNDLLRTRARLLKTAQERDNGSDVVVRKEVAVRRMQLKIFEAKGVKAMSTIIADDIDWRQYRKRFAKYMWNICAHTDDRSTVRQVRNHFAYWLAIGAEDPESEKALTAVYDADGDGDTSAFSYPAAVKMTLVTGLYALLGAALIGMFMSV